MEWWSIGGGQCWRVMMGHSQVLGAAELFPACAVGSASPLQACKSWSLVRKGCRLGCKAEEFEGRRLQRCVCFRQHSMLLLSASNTIIRHWGKGTRERTLQRCGHALRPGQCSSPVPGGSRPKTIEFRGGCRCCTYACTPFGSPWMVPSYQQREHWGLNSVPCVVRWGTKASVHLSTP